jgi:hypothetical protein
MTTSTGSLTRSRTLKAGARLRASHSRRKRAEMRARAVRLGWCAAMKLVAPEDLAAQAAAAGFVLEDSNTIASPGGKLFAARSFRSG